LTDIAKDKGGESPRRRSTFASQHPVRRQAQRPGPQRSGFTGLGSTSGAGVIVFTVNT
jgi:hypothetical protein